MCFETVSGQLYLISPKLLLSRFWFFKFLILVGITVGAFFIPDGTFHNGTNLVYWQNKWHVSMSLIYQWQWKSSLFVQHSLWRIDIFCISLYPSVWFYFGMIGSFIFIIIQLILLIDFAHSWNKGWVERAEENDNKCWYAGTWKSSIFLFISIQFLFVTP